jgi:hypothetical protein
MATCQWCGREATAKVVVERERYRAEKDGEGKLTGRKLLAARAIEADACATHEQMVYREADLAEKRKTLLRLRNSKKLLTLVQKETLGRLERELAGEVLVA